MNMFEYICNTYGVPAEMGRRISYKSKETGTIVGCKGSYLRVKFDGDAGKPLLLHPTWEVKYLAEVRPPVTKPPRAPKSQELKQPHQFILQCLATNEPNSVLGIESLPGHNRRNLTKAMIALANQGMVSICDKKTRTYAITQAGHDWLAQHPKQL